MQALLYALPSIWQCQCWQWFTIYSIYFRFGRWPGTSKESSPFFLLSTQGPFSIIPLDDDWASCPQISGLHRPWGNDRPWESEKQYPSSSCSAALLSRSSWIVTEAAKFLAHLLLGEWLVDVYSVYFCPPTGCGQGISLLDWSQDTKMHSIFMFPGCRRAYSCSPRQCLLAMIILKQSEVFPWACFLLWFWWYLQSIKNSKNKNRAYVFFSIKGPKKCCCKETCLTFFKSVSPMYLPFKTFPQTSAFNFIEILWGNASIMNLKGLGVMLRYGVMESDYFVVNIVLYYPCDRTG